MLEKIGVAGLALATLACASPAARQVDTDEYDYVVIGSGLGGGPVSANLARAGHSVFVIEAGGDHGAELVQQMPLLSRVTAEDETMSWAFYVHHYQNDTQARRDHKYTYRQSNGSLYVGINPPEGATPMGILYPRGSTLGGSGQVNAMNYAMPPDSDWAYIAELTGDDSWRPEAIRESFVAMERCEYLPPGSPDHGFDGYVANDINNISYAIDNSAISATLREALRLIEGVEVRDDEHFAELLVRDVNAPNSELYAGPGAVFFTPAHVDSRRRRSGSRDYLVNTAEFLGNSSSPSSSSNATAATRGRLVISTHSLATRVLFDKKPLLPGKKPRAVGVEYLYGEGLYGADKRYDPAQQGELRTVRARQEVIVAGGAFNTPQILKLSGVGPREELERHGIPVVKDLPAVGRYLQDNYEAGVIHNAQIAWPTPLEGCAIFESGEMTPEDPCLQQWLNASYSGPYGIAGAPMTLTYRSRESENNETDIFVFGSVGFSFTGFWPGYSTDRFQPRAHSWSVVKMQPGNTAGTVTLASPDPRVPPRIDFNYFDEQGQRDLRAMQEAAGVLLEVMERSTAGTELAPLEVLEPTPGMPLEQAFRDQVFGHHATSTCRMGPKEHPDYCVDSEFRVNGVDGLRVVDASVFPRTPGAFPANPILVIAEKASRVILAGGKPREDA